MKKICKNCGKELIEGADVCINCGKIFSNKSNNSKKLPLWAITLIISLCMWIILVNIAFIREDNRENNLSNPTHNNTENKNEPTYKVNEPFMFDGFEIIISDTISFTTLKNQFSKHNGKTVIKVPVKITNKNDDDDSLSMFNVEYFGIHGAELEDVSFYFDNTVERAENLLPEGSYTKYFYFLYEGNGTYTIKFHNGKEKIYFKLNIAK